MNGGVDDEPEAITEADERRARRAGRWVRLAFYPAAAVLAAVLLLGRDQAAGAPVTTKFGSTNQGRQFELGLDEKGRVATFDTHVIATCPSGRQVAMPWDPVDGDPVPFERDGDRLRVTESGDGWKLGLDARSTGKGGLRGKLTLVVHVRPKTRAPFDCTARGVTFFAGR
jgi:hypothetical protein